jgi:hypothetical protein
LAIRQSAQPPKSMADKMQGLDAAACNNSQRFVPTHEKAH